MNDCAKTTPSNVSLQQPVRSPPQLRFARNVPPIYSLITIKVVAASSSGSQTLAQSVARLDTSVMRPG